MVKSLCDEDQSRPEKEKELSVPTSRYKPSATSFSYSEELVCLTFAGFRAAKTVKQLTQEAMTSTGGEITVVSLVGEQCTVLSKMNTTCSTTDIFQLSLPKSLLSVMEKQESPQLGIASHQGFPQRHKCGL